MASVVMRHRLLGASAGPPGLGSHLLSRGPSNKLGLGLGLGGTLCPCIGGCCGPHWGSHGATLDPRP